MVSRGVYHHFLDPAHCQQLLLTHRSLAVVGYRPCVTSLTLFDLALTEPRLLPAVIRVRQLIWDIVEEHFDKPCQIFVEHTSLISWSEGANIGWHHDSNQEYLAQRHFSAVAYLNTKDLDFTGGTFCFQSGSPPLRIEPAAGTLLLYTADDCNVHQVEPVTSGERCTLTMWFTLDEAHAEDRKVLSQLASPAVRGSGLPATMYQRGPDSADIRLAQLQQLGVKLVQSRAAQPALTARQQQQGGQQQRSQSAAVAQQQQQQQQQESQALYEGSECFVLVASGDNADADDGEAGECIVDSAMQFSSIQDAALTLYMLQWRLCHHRQHTHINVSCASIQQSSKGLQSNSDTATGQGDTQLNQQQPAPAVPSSTQEQTRHAVCGCYSDPKRVARAHQLLQEYLQLAGEEFEQLLPVWLQLGSLVLPASVAHHALELHGVL